MQILQVEGSLVCTSRVEGMRHSVFRIVRDKSGKRQAATDPVGAKPGDWVFLASGSAANHSCCGSGCLPASRGTSWTG